MEIMRRTQFPPMEALQDEMNSLFQRFFGRPLAAIGPWRPLANVEETDAEVVVTFELPNVDPKQLNLSVEGRELVVSGERKSTRSEKKATYHLEEMEHGSFQRRVLLPAEVVADKTAADYKAGVLRVTMPKSEVAKRTKIQIQTS